MGVKILVGDCVQCMRGLDAQSIQCVVTSPPYYELRDYGVEGQIGLEESPSAYVERMVEVFAEVWRVLRDDGTVWLNIGDSYYSGNGQPKGRDDRSPSRNFIRERLRFLDTPGMGLPKKSLLGIPWRVAHALQAAGWTVRSEITWFRKTAFTEAGVTDRPSRQHETIFLLSKSRRYTFDTAAIPDGTVWEIEHQRGMRGHGAAFPLELPERCIAASCPAGGTILDPFGGSGTTAVAAQRKGLDAVLCELNPSFADLARRRLEGDGLFSNVTLEAA